MNGYKTLDDHLRSQVCNGNDEYYKWLKGWFAHAVQKPRERPETAIVFRGGEGIGKSIVAEAFGKLVAPHYFLVDHPRYVTGQFNAHMASCLFLFVDEGVWAGDKTAEGTLKSVVTSKMHMIERKGVDAVRHPNYVRLMIASNNDWVVPAGKDARRWFVLDVNPRCKGNQDYFAEMQAELKNGGYEALLYDLLHFDLSQINIREAPKTVALLDQKIEHFDSVETWIYDRLWNGTPTRKHERWPSQVRCSEMFDDYLTSAEITGQKRRKVETELGMRLPKLISGMARRRSSMRTTAGTERPWVYVLPALEDCRSSFEEGLGQPIPWPPIDDDSYLFGVDQ